MSIYPNMTEQDSIILREIAIQQKNQRAIKIKNRVSKRTHDIKLAKSLSPTTEKLEKVKETARKTGDKLKESNCEKETPQLVIENTSTNQQIEINKGVIYDRDLEKTLQKMKNNTEFFKTHEHPERGWLWNGYPIKIKGGTEEEINENK